MTNSHKTANLTILLVLTALLATQALSAFPANTKTAHADSTTLTVPDNYPTINSAVANASQGDTILVKSGTYNENIAINIPLSIIGENPKTTIIIGKGGQPNTSVFNVSANNVKVSGFTIQSTDYSTQTKYATGIGIAGDNCTITNNNIQNVYRGIYIGGWQDLCGGKSNTTISQNNITGTYSDGIRLFGGSGNQIFENKLTACNASAIAIDGYQNQIYKNTLDNNRQGIGVGSSNTVIFANNITDSINWGIYYEASNVMTVANYISGNRWGVYLSPVFAPGNNAFYHNDFTNNTKHVNIGSTYNIQTWDNGYPSGGNYWSNYTGIDSNKDGIGDASFILDPNNTDKYPLTNRYDTTNPGNLPNVPQPGTPQTDGTVALWHFDEVTPNGATQDATGNNPAVLGSATGNVTCPPLANLVDGKFGKALNFDIPQYGWAFASPSLDIPQNLTLDVWVKITNYENTTYNNFVVYCARTLDKYPERIYGLAVNGMSPENATSGPQGALQAYLYTDSGYNEIVTTQPAVSLNTWTHVTFTRDLATGMHIYVNGKEQNVRATYGTQNPTGNIKKGTELNIGHDYIGMIDELRISNQATTPTSATQNTSIFSEWWFWTTIAAGTVFIAGIALFLKQTRKL